MTGQHLFTRAAFTIFAAAMTCTTTAHVHAQVFFHRHTTCNRHGIQNQQLKLRYGLDKGVASSKQLAVADAAVDAQQVNAVGVSIRVQEKRFHVAATSIATDRITLKNVGIAIFSSGEVIFTGILDHNGGVDGGLRGSNVVVRVRLYTGVAEHERIDDAPMVLESRGKFWVFKDQPQSADFGRLTANQADRVKRFFQKITHAEIELEHRIDR